MLISDLSSDVCSSDLAGLLDHQQLPVDRAAAVDVPQVPAAQGGPGEVTDAAPDDDHAERARKLFAGLIAFLKSAPALQHLPAPTVPEIAFSAERRLEGNRWY